MQCNNKTRAKGQQHPKFLYENRCIFVCIHVHTARVHSPNTHMETAKHARTRRDARAVKETRCCTAGSLPGSMYCVFADRMVRGARIFIYMYGSTPSKCRATVWVRLNVCVVYVLSSTWSRGKQNTQNWWASVRLLLCAHTVYTGTAYTICN